MTGRTGTFVTLEGVDGCGKSTKAALLAADLKAAGHEVVTLRDPGSTAISEKIRALVLDLANTGMADECELLLYEAARAQLVREIIIPALDRGAVVVCDRFLDSTIAYQASARGLPRDLVDAGNALGRCGVMPDRTVVFDIDPAAAYGHAARPATDRLEAEGLDFQRRVRNGYLGLAARHPRRIRVVDGSGSVEEVYARLVDALADLLPALRDGRGHA